MRQPDCGRYHSDTRRFRVSSRVLSHTGQVANPRPKRTGKRAAHPTAAEIAEQTQRDARVLALLAEQWSLDEVATEVGFADRSGAWKAMQRGLANALNPNAEKLRAVWRARYEGLWQLAIQQHFDGDERALDKALRIADSVVRFEGLIRPSAQHVTHEFAVPETPEERRAQIIALTDQVRRAAGELTSRADDDAARG